MNYILVEIDRSMDWDEIRNLVDRCRQAKVKMIVVSDSSFRDALLECVRLGAWGLFLTENGMDDLIETIDQAEKGWCKRDMFGAPVSGGPAKKEDVLTRRESEVLSLVRAHLSNKQIAKKLGKSLYTIKNHVHNILEKLGVTDRHEAADKYFLE